MANLSSRIDSVEQKITALKPVLTFEEACNYTGLSESWMYKLTSRKQIPHSKPFGKKIFFSREALDLWLLQNPLKMASELDTEAATYLTTK